MVDVVRALLAALDLPATDLRHLQKRLDQDVQGQVAAGKKPFLLPPVRVYAAAGLYAASAQAAFASKITGPVAAARNRVAQCAVHENFQIQPFRAGFGKQLDLVHVQFARQDDPVHAQFLADHGQGGRLTHIGQGGKMDLALEPGLTGNVDDAQILNDERMRLDHVVQPLYEPSGRVCLALLEQNVHGNVQLGVMAFGQLPQRGHFLEREVVGLHAGGKMLESCVDGVGTGGQSRQKRFLVASRGKNLWLVMIHICM